MLSIQFIMATLAVTVAVPFHDDNSIDWDYLGDSSIEDRREPLKYGNSLARAITYNKPTVPLEFWDKVKKKPRGRQMKESKLKEKMGTDFDPSWMSVERPLTSKAYIVTSLPESQVAELMEEVSSLDIENQIRKMLSEKDEEAGEHEPTVRKAVGAFQQWLVKKSSCPVRFGWEDLGEYFWPRYIQKGSCDVERMDGSRDDGTVSCSWPRGMQCGPADSKVLQILRWHCRIKHQPRSPFVTATRKNLRKSYKCRWIKIPYPVTSSCRCQA